NVADFKTNDKTMKVSVRNKVREEEEKDAENYDRKTKPQIAVAGKVVTLSANTQGAGNKGVATDMDIYVPANTALAIVSGRGDVTIAGMAASVDVTHHRGAVKIENQTGNVVLNLEGSSVRIGQVKGDVNI